MHRLLPKAIRPVQQAFQGTLHTGSSISSTRTCFGGEGKELNLQYGFQHYAPSGVGCLLGPSATSPQNWSLPCNGRWTIMKHTEGEAGPVLADGFALLRELKAVKRPTVLRRVNRRRRALVRKWREASSCSGAAATIQSSLSDAPDRQMGLFLLGRGSAYMLCSRDEPPPFAVRVTLPVAL